MEFFKFNPTGADETIIKDGEVINGIDKALWVERYRDPGEFSFEAKVSTGLRNFLPIGTLISHADTLEMMIVENHEITETLDEDPTIIISGRSFISYLENRIIGVNAARQGFYIAPYTLVADYTWNQAEQLINDHIRDTYSPNDALSQVNCGALVADTGKISEARTIEIGNVLERALELLAIDDVGIKTIRRNTFGIEGDPTATVIYIHKGVDRTASVLFSWKSGDLASAQYLFTDKSDKNSAIVVGRYAFVMYDAGPTKYDRRIAIVDGSDIDGHFDTVPAGTDLTNIVNAMYARGRLALGNQKAITIMQTDLSKNAKYEHRKHFNVGDLVSLDGNYGQIQVFRVVEYAEIQDENGESGHPTLAPPGV